MPNAASVKSVQIAKKNLEKFLKTLDTVPQEELDKTAQAIKAKAIAQTPYKTGKLESSVYVNTMHRKSLSSLEAGASAFSERGYDYAGIQHEETSYSHPIKGKAHYISDPFKQEVYNMKQRIRRRLKVKKNGS